MSQTQQASVTFKPRPHELILYYTQVRDMYQAYKFRLYPNTEQEIALAKSFGCCRWFWNYSLNLCQETYQATGKHLAKYERNLKRKQKKLARKKKGSNNRQKARQLVAKVHAKIARCREDFLHKLSRKIVNKNQVIAVENLNIKGMVCNRNLTKAISDCGWVLFCRMLKYKAENEGKTYIEVDRWFPSSKTCSACLNRVSRLPLDVRSWTCEHCQTNHDRDINASINIRNEALRILSLGTSDTANRGDVRRLGGKISCLLDAMPDEVRSPNYIACN